MRLSGFLKLCPSAAAAAAAAAARSTMLGLLSAPSGAALGPPCFLWWCR
jgi:hypothetical protein